MRRMFGSRVLTCWCLLGLIAFLLFYYVHHYRDERQHTQQVAHKNIATFRVKYIAERQHYTTIPTQSDHHHQRNIKSIHSYRFVLGLNFWEQLTMATNNLLHLVCLADSLNASTVQPFTYNSRLYGLQMFKADEHIGDINPARDLELVFNMDSLNGAIESKGLPRLVKFRDFLKYASREVVVLHYIPMKEIHELPVMVKDTGKRIRTALQRKSVIDCKNELKDYRIRLTNAFNAELDGSNQHFTIVKYLCVNMSTMTTPQRLAKRADIDSNGDLTLVVVNWRGTSRSQVIKRSAKGSHVNNRVVMKNTCEAVGSLAVHKPILYSDSVREIARKFVHTLHLGEKYIGVHVRGEKLGFREQHYPNSVHACIHELLKTKDRLVAEEGLSKRSVIYTTDYGQYSSDTCRSCAGGRRVMRLLKGSEMWLIKFDPTLQNLPEDSGFVGAVEAELLASATYIVLCGGGSFQNHIGQLFLEYNNSSQRLISVCTDDKSIVSLLNQTSNTL